MAFASYQVARDIESGGGPSWQKEILQAQASLRREATNTSRRPLDQLLHRLHHQCRPGVPSNLD